MQEKEILQTWLLSFLPNFTLPFTLKEAVHLLLCRELCLKEISITCWWAGNTGRDVNPDWSHSQAETAVGLLVSLFDETLKENLQMPSGCHFTAQAAPLSSHIHFECVVPSLWASARSWKDPGISQTLLQPEPHFFTSVSEQSISEVLKTREGISWQSLIIPVCWICGHQHAGLQIGTWNMLCDLVTWI